MMTTYFKASLQLFIKLHRIDTNVRYLVTSGVRTSDFVRIAAALAEDAPTPSRSGRSRHSTNLKMRQFYFGLKRLHVSYIGVETFCIFETMNALFYFSITSSPYKMASKDIIKHTSSKQNQRCSSCAEVLKVLV